MVAAAGPLVSLILAALLLGAGHSAAHASPLLGAMVNELGGLNLILALFNLLPGLPLDGGLILKALVWQFSGSQRKGTQVATATGRFLSLAAIGLGVVLLLRGASVGGLWLMLLGWFGLGAARSQSQLLALKQLSRIRLGDGNGLADWLLVTRQGRWQGFITDAPLQQLPVQRWQDERVGDHLQPLEELPQISAEAPLWQAVLQLDQPDTPRLLVMGPAGLPSGTLERPELAERVLETLGVRLPQAILEAARRQGVYPLGMGLAPVARSIEASSES
jgi:hypothetical protein